MADMSYLKDKPIAVLGAGGVGKAIAGEMCIRDRLYPSDTRLFKGI